MLIIALLILIHILASFTLIIAVLLQSGKGADLAGAFGGGGSQTAFGSRGPATFLSRMTTGAAITFMVTSLTLSLFYNQGTSSALPSEDLTPGKPAAGAPVKPVPASPDTSKTAPAGGNAPVPVKSDQKPPEAPKKP